ncbi:helix-turn-helix transcriptional regulator [Paraneptunicella aestuarii]|uniref:helix-turn-helix domain-containing protein n=1 Tax=Paraneptunicella aestuarii TaxID=2831148 RepID=UPI001E5DA111|nr:helix-turn-helix transcriptional regulator [Paraneptunicella aestuarii]UAA39619.1 helix-turn-helix transcriptional regulator [Paraneptunicella aestuarii]
MSEIENLIRRLYCQSSRIAPEAFRQWALMQLIDLMNADAALWGTGNLGTLEFHYQEHIGLDDHYGERLANTLDINPIRQAVLQNLHEPVLMSEVFPDEAFFQSELYQNLFEPYGVKRILATGCYEQESGLYTLISLYRFDAENDFNNTDKEHMQRLVYHLNAAASYNYFLHLQQQDEGQTAAICDKHGIYWQTHPEFFALLHNQANSESSQTADTPKFSYPLVDGGEYQQGDLHIRVTAQGELFRVSVRQLNPLDTLSEREQQIVNWIVQGLTFKEVAKELDLAPSTISNHLYRIYRKLDIASRSQLAKLYAKAQA